MMKLKLPNSKRQPGSLNKWGVGAAAVALALTLSLYVGCDGAYCATAKPKTDLDKLEMKYFRHMYPENDNTARLRRLEKMVFGEEKTGSEQERLASILATVPDLGEEEPAPPPKATGKGSGDESSTANAPDAESQEEGGDIGDYPAVTAIEKHAFGKDFANEPVGGRLARLEKKLFGKPSASEDLSERVDALKAATRVDVTRKGPPGTEWAEEEAEDGSFPEPNRATAQDYPGSGIGESGGEDGKSFSGRDLRKDFERAGMRRNASGGYSSSGSYRGAGSSGTASGRTASGGSGSYGMSGGGGSYGAGSGSYGMGAGTNYGSSGSYGSGGGFSGSGSRQLAQTPRTAPSYKSQGSYDSEDAPTGGSGGASPGLTQQVDALEKEVFGKTFAKSKTLPDRVSDLEKTIFPQDTKVISGIKLEDRVARMTAVIPIAAPNVAQQQQPQQYQQPPQQQQYDPYNDPNMTANNGMPRRGGGGLGKIINSLGSFMSGGMSVGGTGGYPMNGYGSPYGAGTYVDPTTGMVIRQNVPYMTNPGYGMGGFNNGFSSPYYSPYSNPMGGMGGMGGINGGGIRFGTGGFGGSSSGFGGTWP